MTTVCADVAFADDASLGEGPVWDPATESLWWTDVPRRRLLQGDPRSGLVAVTSLTKSVASFALCGDGSFLCARRGEVNTFGPDGVISPVGRLPGPAEASVQINDGKCDPGGRFWVGSISQPVEDRAGALFRVDSGTQAELVLTGVGISNGMGWAPDGRTFYYVDSLTQSIDAFSFDLDSGALYQRRRLVDVDPDDGLPDGMAVDAEGGVWLALYFAGRVHRYTPKGTLDKVLELPVPCVASVAFGGSGLSSLFITTGRLQETPMAKKFGATVPESQPRAGCVFACDPGVAGAPVALFAG